MMLLDPDAVDESVGTLQCRECGVYVSKGFARVFGDNQDRVDGCPACTTFRERSEGAVTPEDDPGIDSGW
jgi:hypothetical protein